MTIVSGPPLPPETRMIWVGDYARVGAEACPDRTAFVCPERGTTVSYREFDWRVRRACAWLSSQGLGRDDRIAYYGRNSDLYVAVLLAAIRQGIVMVPLNWRCVAPEIAYFIEDSGTRLILCDPEFHAIAQAASAIAQAPAIVLTEGETGDGHVRELIEAEGETIDEAIAWTRDGVCLQLYTSGTTGRPKGVLSRHHALSIARFQEQSWADFPNWQGGTIVSAMPNFHIGGMSWVLMGLLRRSTCVLTGDASAANITRLLVAHRAERTFAVPTVIRAIVDEVRATGIAMPWLEAMFYGAAPMSPSLLADAIATLGCGFGQYFGMTEITGTATFLGPADHDPARPRLLGSVGKPYPGVDVEIRDAAGRPVAGATPGEIWIRTPSIMREYWHRPEATAEVLRDGWYRTGDGGYLDEDGFLFLTDRIKDMIVSGGENVYPVEVEEALRRFPAVYEAAVVAVPHERWGETVAALIECRPGMTADTDELIRFARTQLAPYKCPRHVAVIEQLPRTASGKIQRASAKAMMRDLLAERERKPV